MKQTVLLLTLALFCVLIPGNFAHAFGGSQSFTGNCEIDPELVDDGIVPVKILEDQSEKFSFEGCSYTINYEVTKYNATPTPFYAFKEMSIKIDGNDPDCVGKSMEDIYGYAVARLISEVGWMFDVMSPEDYFVDVNTPACFKSSTTDGEELFEACSQECCKIRYRIQVANGAPYVAASIHQNSATFCTPKPGPFPGPVVPCDPFENCDMGEVPLYSELPYGPHWSCEIPCPDNYFYSQPQVRYELNKNPIGEYCAVNYAKRDCDILELALERVETEYRYNGPDITWDQMFEESIRNLLADIIDINGSFTDEVVVRIPTCWNPKIITKGTVYHKMILEPCDVNLCCSATYTLDNNNGVISVVGVPLIDNQWEQEDCIPIVCLNMCDKLENITGSLPIIQTGVHEDFNSLDNILFAPNPALGLTSVSYSGVERGGVVAIVYDLNGYLIQEFIDRKHDEKFTFTFNAALFSPGAYYMKILIGNKLVANGKFIVK